MAKKSTLLAFLFLSGCAFFLQEPYPGWEISYIRYKEMPSVVRKEFEKIGADRVDEVAKSVFGSRLQGYPAVYRIKYRKDGLSFSILYDEKGKLSHLDFWFHGERGEPSALRFIPAGHLHSE